MSKIEWTDRTWNPVTGCSRVSPGCDNCYMFAQYPRLKGMGVPGYELEPNVVQTHPYRLRDVTGAGVVKPRRIFVNSMSDTFHRDVPYAFIDEMFAVMASTPHTYQVLTKRPGRAVHWWETRMDRGGFRYSHWPRNVWIGTSVETQKYAPRVEVLKRLPAPTKFVSAEPLLDYVYLMPWLHGTIQWVIAGGESGRNARPMDLAWARHLRDQCQTSGVAFFYKQEGGKFDKRGGDDAVLDGRRWLEFPDDRRLL